MRGIGPLHDEPRAPWNIDGNKISWTQGNSIVATAVVATVEDTLSRYLSANFSPANRIYDGPSSYQRELKCPTWTTSFIAVKILRVHGRMYVVVVDPIEKENKKVSGRLFYYEYFFLSTLTWLEI